MKFTTHIIFSIFLLMTLYEIYPDLSDIIPFAFALIPAIFGALLPDIDHPKAFISQGYWSILSKAIRMTTRHRGWTHSLLGATLFTLMFASFLWYVGISLVYAFIFLIGYLSHLISDSLNPTKIKWLWPKQERYGIGIIKTNSKSEDVFAWIVAILIAVIYWLDITYGRFILSKI